MVEVDTDVVVRLLTADDPRQAGAARPFLNSFHKLPNLTLPGNVALQGCRVRRQFRKLGRYRHDHRHLDQRHPGRETWPAYAASK